MENKVTQFPQSPNVQSEVLVDAPMILFSCGDRRFAIQWTITELCVEPAEVIPIEKNLKRKKRSRPAQM